MVAIGVSTASSADVLSLARGSGRGNGNSDDSRGFQDVLNKSGSGSDGRTTAANSGSKGKPGDSSDAQSGAPPKPGASAPSDTNGKAATLTQGQTPAQPQPSAAPADGTAPPEAAAPETDSSNLSPADIAQQLAAMVAGEGAAQAVTDGPASPTDVKGDKTTTKADSHADEETASDVSVANGAITDVLTLLGGVLPASAVPAQTAPSVLAAAGQLHGGNGKTVASADASGTLPADVPSDQPTAAVTGMAMLASTSGTLGNANAEAGQTTTDDATQTFSLERVSSKAQMQDLASAKAADEAQQLDVKSATGDSVGTVTVLESRRFVGLADGSNSALVANALTGNKDWAAAMQSSDALTGASATTSASKVMNSLKIQMNPENLGIVTATMRLSGEQLSVDLKVHSAEAYRQLSNDQSAMIDSLRQQGYSVDRVTVTYSSPDTSSNNNQPSAQGQQQQSGASQGQGSDAQARKQNSGRQAGDQDGVWGTGNSAADDVTAGNAQRARAGGVYL